MNGLILKQTSKHLSLALEKDGNHYVSKVSSFIVLRGERNEE